MSSELPSGRAGLSSWESQKPQNYFTADPSFQTLLQLVMAERFSQSTYLFEKTGAIAATQMNVLAVESNRDENLPRLARFDGMGNRLEAVEFHPSYHELGALVWGTGILSLLKNPGNDIAAGALLYLMAHNGEGGHLCPVACTAGAIKLIQQLGTSEQKETYLPRLLASDYSRSLHAAQFLTEVQGGSDVGSNTTVATPVDATAGWFRITGEKWFCSVMDAGLYVVTARPEGGLAGTKGLGLFLVPRIVDGRVNEFSIRRLKTKLGTRSMATGETEFSGALAQKIGALDEGFKNVVRIVLDTSRVYNALTACGVMRRAFIEARTFAENRTAFGERILEFPLVQRTLARMKLQAFAAAVTTFRILEMTELIERGAGSSDLAAARRIDVSINKYWTSSRCTDVVRAGIEVLGGNGTIEDFSVLPRLYRDAIVLESWEGTHNTLCMQVLRDFAHRQMHQPWIAEIRRSISQCEQSSLVSHRQNAMDVAADVERRISELLTTGEKEASLWIRDVVDRMCRLNEYAGLLRVVDFAWSGQTSVGIELLDYYRLCFIDSVDSADPRLAQIERRLCAEL